MYVYVYRAKHHIGPAIKRVRVGAQHLYVRMPYDFPYHFTTLSS